MRPRVDWVLCFIAGSVVICVGFAIANAVLYTNHPHGRGLNLFAMVWCTLMGAWSLHSAISWMTRDGR